MILPVTPSRIDAQARACSSTAAAVMTQRSPITTGFDFQSGITRDHRGSGSGNSLPGGQPVRFRTLHLGAACQQYPSDPDSDDCAC